MTLRGKLVLAQAPLAVALALLGALSAGVTSRLGAESRNILAANYRSVLAAERMKEAVERIDAAVLFGASGHAAEASAEAATHRRRFEDELAAQERNITESGEGVVTRELRAAWGAYVRAVDETRALADARGRDAAYVARLRPAYARVDALADRVLAINQDAMVRKGERAQRRAAEFERLVALAVFLALAAGIAASAWLTTRLLRPLGVVAAAVRRFGQHDLKARAAIVGVDEIAAVATEFNRMADGLERYRRSSLGELLQAQQAAQAAIDSLPDPVLLLGADGALTGANDAAARVLGVVPDRPVAETYAAVDPGVRAVVDRLRAHVLSGRGAYVPKGFEDAVRVTTPADGERIFVPRAAPIYSDEGAVAGAALVLQDSTRLFRFDELKNDLVATVAHELRTPLTSLRMALHLCTEGTVGPLNDKQADLLFAARDDCERLQVIVDELLNLSRIESGQIELHRRRAAPGALVDATLEIHRAAARQAGLELAAEVPPGLPDVFVDPDRLQLVFSNLVTNAVRFAPSGTRVVIRAVPVRPDETVRDHRLAEPDHVRFEVRDDGPGIAPEHQASLFEKFFRVPGSPAGGSGLGLFIAKGLVQAHGGAIGVDSAPGRGTTFWFTAPRAARA